MKKIVALTIISGLFSCSLLQASCPSIDEVRGQVNAFTAKGKGSSDDGKYWLESGGDKWSEKATGKLNFGPTEDGSCHYYFNTEKGDIIGVMYTPKRAHKD